MMILRCKLLYLQSGKIINVIPGVGIGSSYDDTNIGGIKWTFNGITIGNNTIPPFRPTRPYMDGLDEIAAHCKTYGFAVHSDYKHISSIHPIIGDTESSEPFGLKGIRLCQHGILVDLANHPDSTVYFQHTNTHRSFNSAMKNVVTLLTFINKTTK